MRALCMLAGVLAGLTPAWAQDPIPIQGQLVRTMIVTCKPDETIRFYRDVLGMRVLRDDGGRPVQVAPLIMAMPPDGIMRMAIFEGSGEYPAGPIIGSRIGMLGLVNPDDPACANMDAPNSLTVHGGVVMPIRVANTPEILRRAKAMGIEIIRSGPSPSRLTTQTLLYDPNGIVLELFELNVAPLPEE